MSMWSKKVPDVTELYVVIKQDQSHFEVNLHVKKTIDGVFSLLKRGSGMTSGHAVKVYRLDMKDSELILEKTSEGKIHHLSKKCPCCGR